MMKFSFDNQLSRVANLVFSVVIAVSLICSCEEIVTPPDIENIEDKLVVNSIISSQDSIYVVEVTLSSPSFGQLRDYEDDYVRDAVVSISDGNTTAVFNYDEQERHYQLQADIFPIKPETTYVLSVSTKGMDVMATCHTETPVEQLESYEIGDNNSLTVEWKDTKGQVDHYLIAAFLKRGDGEFNNIIPYFFDGEIISDKSRDGKVLQDAGESFDPPRDGDVLQIIIYRYDELYADYFEILNNYFGDDPFSQPVQLPGNIEGGLGIFSIVQPYVFETVIGE